MDGCIPSDLSTGEIAQIEEERRLLYVALTRAQRHLHVMVPQRFYVHQQSRLGGRHVYASLTRFIPEPVSRLFEAVGPLTPDGQARPQPTGGDATLDVLARVRAQWD